MFFLMCISLSICCDEHACDDRSSVVDTVYWILTSELC